MSNPRNYPDQIRSAETGRTLHRGIKTLTIVDRDTGFEFSYGQPGWWASVDDPQDLDGQLADEDNLVRAAARREARARGKKSTVLTPLVIRAIRERCGLSQAQAGEVFGGGPKAFEKYEVGEIVPSGAMMRLLRLAMEKPNLFKKDGIKSRAANDTALVRKAIRGSSVEQIYDRIYPRPRRA